MNILGVSAHFHDASAALVVDGRVIAAAAEERFTRQKHDANFPQLATQFCLAQAGLETGDLDKVVFYEQPHVKFTRILASTLAGFPRSAGAFVGAMKGWVGSKLFVRNSISRQLNIHPASIEFVSHHTSHATHAFLSSPFDEAAILTVDAVGEWVCTSIARGRRGEPTPVTFLERLEYPHSLGLVYAAFTAFFGFQPNSDECSTMALAAFGQPTRVEDLRAVLRLHDDGTYQVDPRYFDFLATRRLPFTRRFLKRFGQPAGEGAFSALDVFRSPEEALPPALQGYADLAASLQVVLEEALLGLARLAKEKTGLDQICFAGGVALNCVANRRLQQEGPFRDLFVPPDPGDGGGALGAALAVAAAYESDVVGGGAGDPYLGKAFEAEPCVQMVEAFDDEIWDRVGAGATATQVPEGVHVQRCATEEELLERTVSLLGDGALVGWVQGRFENGPRALGNRSLLMRPDDVEAARRLSRTVKSRAPFRPYALSVTEEHAPAILAIEGEIPAPMRWMQMTAPVRPEMLQKVRAAAHVDATTRPQICGANDNPRFHRLLTAYGERFGQAALLNTSLNERGLPMVASPTEAVAMFARTDMDVLILDRVILRKEWPCPT